MSKKEQLQQLIDNFVINNCYDDIHTKEETEELVEAIDTLYKVEEWI